MVELRADDEIVFLRGAWGLIDEMVNYELLDLRGSDPHSEVRFHSNVHQRYFSVLLVDFLSKTDPGLKVTQMSFLGALRSIAQAPNFEKNGSVQDLRGASEEFAEWLNTEVEVDTWMPSIDTRALLKLPRIDFLKLCGNISKHSFLRSAGFAEELRKCLSAAGREVAEDQSLLALGDFHERFHTDVLSYHASTIAEFLNSLRWGIYEYLRPERASSVRSQGGNVPQYRYEVPANLVSDFARSCYWDLMNAVRSEPYMRRFRVTRWLKKDY